MFPGIAGISGFNSTATTSGGASWWRIYIDAGETEQANCDISGVIFRTTPGGSNVLSGGTAYAGGAGAAETFTTPANAISGSGSLYRRSVDAAWYWGYHFASPVDIVEIVKTNGGIRGRSINKARLQYSLDTTDGTDGTWVDVFTIYDPVPEISASDTWPQDLSGAGGKYKAYRFVWTATPTANRTIIAEMEMLNSGTDYATSGKVRCTALANEVNLCDNNAASDATSSFVSAGTATFSMVDPIALTGYSLQAGAGATGGARCPRDWTLDGTNDGTTWTNISTKSGETFTNGQKKTY